ncbi:MAG: DHH family phosphoesterase [Phycisphaeraceae bacterium]|nr:DHH family phosphoesterase [Phycisphaeraceae bacterium]
MPEPVVLAQVDQLARDLSLPKLVAQLLCQRGMTDAQSSAAFLDPKLTALHDPVLLPGCRQAAQRLKEAVAADQPIVIYGDYDVDGVTASAILWHVLTMAGGKVYCYIPHRVEEGYGLNEQAITRICQGQIEAIRPEVLSEAGASANGTITLDRKPLIVSVDCGVTGLKPAALAAAAGVDMIITDHHEFDPQGLPQAHTIVHPRLPPGSTPAPESDTGNQGYPFPSLCGAGVALKVAWQFAREHCGSDRLPEAFRQLLLDLLSLAALGTIADVVPLVGENRILVRYGLGQVKRTRFTGLNALIDASRLRDGKIDAYHVGFVLAPRLNACGRMGHARDAVYLFTEASLGESAVLADFLSRQNDLRRRTEKIIFDQAQEMIVAHGYDGPECRAIVLAREDWHPGVVGIVASRLVEAHGRPVVLLNLDHGRAHGSARSIEGVSIHDALRECAEHLTSFGGHAMAAGMELPVENIPAFRQAMNAQVSRQWPREAVGGLAIDAECDLGELSLPLFEQIQRLAPFGRANPPPLLCLRRVQLMQSPQRMGAGGAHLKLLLGGSRRGIGAVGFHLGHLADQLAAGMALDLLFEPKVSTYLGQMQMELHIKDIRPLST